MSYNVSDIWTTVYQIFFRVVQSPKFSIAGAFFLDIFGRITPSLDKQSLQSLPSLRISAIDTRIFLATAFFCFVLTATLCILSGTFYSDNPNVLAFSADKWNILLYLLVCPLYVVFCMRLIFLVAEGPEPEVMAINMPDSPKSRERLFTSLFIILLLSLLLITNYVSDATNTQKITKTYWFLSEIDSVRVLNIAGIYYIALNFSLLIITFLGAASFISVSLDGVKLASELLATTSLTDFSAFKIRLSRLTQGYYYGTFLVFAYVLNVLIWKASFLGATTANINIAGSVLTLMALFFVAIPRRFVQHLWAEYELQISHATDADSCYKDLLSNRDNRIIDLLSYIFLGSWFQSFWGVDLDPLTYFMDLFSRN